MSNGGPGYQTVPKSHLQGFDLRVDENDPNFVLVYLHSDVLQSESIHIGSNVYVGGQTADKQNMKKATQVLRISKADLAILLAGMQSQLSAL